MTVRHSKKIKKSLKKNGFVKLATHHNRYFYKKISGGDTLIHTFISHGSNLSVALGARIIEKQLTLDRKLGGPDAKFSLNLEELKQMAQALRKFLGSVPKKTWKEEHL